MTNNEYPDDRLPEDENLGTAGTPRSSGKELHTHSSAFAEGDTDRSPSFCEVCGCAISPSSTRCSDHQVLDQTRDRRTTDRWGYSHVGFAVVPANSKIHALALATASFKRRGGVPGDGRSFELIETVDDPSRTIVADWGGDLPDATKLSSSKGKSLVQNAASKADSGATADGSLISGVDFTQFSSEDPTDHIFTPDGSSVAQPTEGDLDFPEPDDDQKDNWVIPALLYQRRYDTANNPVRLRECSTCESPQKHVFEGASSSDSNQNVGQWTCLSCHTSFTGTLRSTAGNQADSDTTGPTKDELDRQRHETVMEALERKGELE